MKAAKLFISFAAALTLVTSAHATMIDLSTGLDASGNLISSGGVQDAYWTVTLNGITTPAITVSPSVPNWFGGWAPNGPTSDWVAYSTSVNEPPAPYTFTRAFDLTGYNLPALSIQGHWSIDDGGFLIINGNTINSSGLMGKAFTIPSADLVQGINTLNITMTYDNQNIDAVRLDARVVASVPETSTFVMGFLALGAVWMVWKRRNVTLV